MTDLDRRDLLTAGAMLSVGAAALSPAMAAERTVAPRSFTPLPLPFDPKSITGLSEKLLVSHHDNNYVGAV